MLFEPKSMHRIFQNFVDHLSSALDEEALGSALAEAAAALDLSCFAYLSVPHLPRPAPRLISNYPSTWTAHYLRCHYERFDPVIIQALEHPEPFEWGPGFGSTKLTNRQEELYEEAAQFGIRNGFTIPIHDNHGMIAAVTFAADERRSQFERSINGHLEFSNSWSFISMPMLDVSLFLIESSAAYYCRLANSNASIGRRKASPRGKSDAFSAFHAGQQPFIWTTPK
jgi:hypothetical protein